MLGYRPTVLETKKATILREARIHTYEKPNYLKLPIEALLVLLLLDRFRKELHIVI